MEKKLKDRIEINRAEEIIGKKNMAEELNIADVEAIISYLDIRICIETVKGNLGPLLAPNKRATSEKQKRLATSLTSMQQYEHDSEERKIAFALFTFNVNRETDLTLEDLNNNLPATENYVKKHFAAIFKGVESESKEEDPI